MKKLFAEVAPDFVESMEKLRAALAEAVPLKSTHRRELPHAVRDLSELLTVGRAEMSRPYWADPRLFSAYFHYFLPWNLIRLGRLLPGLSLSVAALQQAPVIVDMGSGPLTFPIALWLSRPDLRALPLTIVATDTSPQPLQAGKRLFQLVSGSDCPWTIRTVRSPLPGALREARAPIGLLTGANVLNELTARRGEPLEERFFELMSMAERVLAPAGQVLLVEPGTRLGGRCVASTRNAALECGLTPASPCPHTAECPMLAPKSTGWCHFSFETGKRSGVPAWLERLSVVAKLAKRTASVSFLHLIREGQISEPDENPHSTTANLPGRILSDPIFLPGRPAGRYACTGHGLVLVQNASRLPMGALLPLNMPENPEFDAKTGAPLVECPLPRPTERPEGRPTNRPAERPAKRPEKRSAERSEGRSAERSADRPTDRPVERSTDRPADRPVKRSADRPAERSTDRSADRPEDRPEQKPRSGKKSPVQNFVPQKPQNARKKRPSEKGRPRRPKI